jgi:hypothetical protein
LYGETYDDYMKEFKNAWSSHRYDSRSYRW